MRSRADARIAELEKLLDDSRRSGKRQAAPFSKGEPTDEPKTPGRRSGKNHGRHGHRRVPVAPIDRELEALCRRAARTAVAVSSTSATRSSTTPSCRRPGR